jgi:hypothetical protein
LTLHSALMGQAFPRLKVSLSANLKLLEVTKTMDEETQSKVKAGNEEARKLREKMADELAHKFSCFKRDFMGAPIWRALKSLKAGNSFKST